MIPGVPKGRLFTPVICRSASFVYATYPTLQILRYISYVTDLTLQILCYTSYITDPTLQILRYTSYVTGHRSRVTGPPSCVTGPPSCVTDPVLQILRYRSCVTFHEGDYIIGKSLEIARDVISRRNLIKVTIHVDRTRCRRDI